MAITLCIKLKNGKCIATDYETDYDQCLKEILSLKESDFSSVIGNFDHVHYNMDFVNNVVCISAENHIELISMKELKNLREVIIIGFYEAELHSEEYKELWKKAYVNERLNSFLLP